MLFVCHSKILHKHCFQFLLGVKMAPRDTENNAYAKFWRDKQRALWYVVVFLEWSIHAFARRLLALSARLCSSPPKALLACANDPAGYLANCVFDVLLAVAVFVAKAPRSPPLLIIMIIFPKLSCLQALRVWRTEPWPLNPHWQNNMFDCRPSPLAPPFLLSPELFNQTKLLYGFSIERKKCDDDELQSSVKAC